MGSGFIFFLFLIISFLGAVLFIQWLVSRWKEVRHAIQSPSTVRHKSFRERATDPELLPEELKNLDPDLELLAPAMYQSLKRYKDLHQYCHKHGYECRARSKRYELKISLTRCGVRKFLLQIILEGKHPHEFNVDFSKLGSTRFYGVTSAITKDELIPFFKSLSFFTKVQVRQNILSAEKIVRSDDSMQNWPQALSGFIRLGHYLMDTELRKEILQAVDILCPYCRGEFSPQEATVSCTECNTRHHKDCWDEVGRCSVFGCNSKKEFMVSASQTN